ncbi:MAG: UMP kinase [Methanobacteriota archaeon]|nr:MAG: UMP kinase [Euryarchaeota archaeon]
MTTMDSVVLSLGGSVLVRDEDNSLYLRDLAKMLVDASSATRIFVVTGGGRIARFYIREGRALGVPESYLDEMGIEVTRLNARLLIAALGEHANHIPPKDYKGAVLAAKHSKIVVMGGVSPGITTDAVASMLAERVGASRLVNATSVDAVYTTDPVADPTARKISNMSHAELLEIVSGTPSKAGPNVVFDATGASVLARANIPLSVVDGRDVQNVRAAIEGDAFEGTLIE